MKSCYVDLSENRSDIRIKVIADIHYGSPKCRVSELKKQIDLIRKDPNCYVILAGDLVDNGTKNSVNPYGDTMSPMEQMRQIITLLEPIKNRIIGMCGGNHEERSYKESGTDLTWFIANQFGLTDIYDPVGLCLFIRCGKDITGAPHKGGNCHDKSFVYSLYFTHGTGGGSTVGGKANALHKRGNVICADIICMGHTHQPMTWKEDMYVANNNGKKLNRVETTYVMTGSFLDYEEYAHKLGLPPSNTSIPTITLNGTSEKRVEVIL